jgi:hypothetical protein
VKDFSPRKPIFSLATQMRMRYQAVDHDGRRWRDDAIGRSAGATQCCFQIINILDVNIE